MKTYQKYELWKKWAIYFPLLWLKTQHVFIRLIKNGEKKLIIITLLGLFLWTFHSMAFDCIPHDLVIGKFAACEFD